MILGATSAAYILGAGPYTPRRQGFAAALDRGEAAEKLRGAGCPRAGL